MANSERDQIIARDVAAIRTAIFGRDVRSAIADGIEQCYTDVSTSKTLADDSTTNANNAAALANQKAQAAQNAINAIDGKIDDIVLVQANQPASPTNKLWVKPESEEYKVPTWEEFQALVNRVAQLEAQLQ